MKRGMSQIITTVIIIDIALAAIGIVWYVINTVVNEQTAQVENSSSKVFQSCKDAGYYKMNTGDICQGVVSYSGGEKCCHSGFVPNYGLISYWSFDVNASDDWGNNSGTVYGATWNSTGGYNGEGAYEFDGVNDYIDCGTNNDLDIGNSTGVTAALWMKFYSPHWGGVLSQNSTPGYEDSTANYEYYVGSNGKVRFYITDTEGNYNSSTTNSDLSGSQWYYLVGMADRSDNTVKLYVNGILQSTVRDISHVGNLDVGRTFIGVIWGTYFFNGTIDEVRIYNRALSEDEVRALYELE